MFKSLEEKVSESYFKHDQWLELESHYESDPKQTEQQVCLIDETKNECIFCVVIQTFSNLESGWEHTPYLIYNPRYDEFMVTVPKFGYLTQEEINKAIKFIIRENVWLVFNVKIDGNRI
jgi:hypothetical protein